MASRTVLAVGVAALVLGWSGGARAQETPISKATEAWELGHLAQAGKLYEEALAGGGLTPSDTLAAFVRVGAWRATQGKTDLALSALRNAAIIDPDFECPALGGPRAKPLCERARKEAAGQEKLALSIEAPEGVKHGVDVPIAATLPETLAPLFDSVALAVEDKPGNVVHAEEKPLGEAGTPTKAASARVEFKVPAAEVPAGATLRVRVSVLDAQKNEWARANTTIRVAAKALPPAPPIEPAAPPPPPPPKSSAFWHGPWPYVIGGAILASAAVTIAVAASSGGGDTVTLHAPTWQPAHFSR